MPIDYKYIKIQFGRFEVVDSAGSSAEHHRVRYLYLLHTQAPLEAAVGIDTEDASFRNILADKIN